MSDWRTITDDREKYNAYLCSREWALLRNAVRERCGGLCERCMVNPMDCVHHLTYARKYDERLDDLAGWCNACHEYTHGKSDHDPRIDWQDRLRELLAWQAKSKQLKDLYFIFACGLHVFEGMGKEWLIKAAAGGFKTAADHEIENEEKYLAELVARRRKEQGIT